MSELPPPSPVRRERLHALDGLRGLAALVVVVHHALLTSSNLVEAQRGRPVSGPFANVITYSPFHLMWAGGEAVVVFFVLSGCVLALPYVGGRRIDLDEYYPKRLVRLIVPVWGSLVLAVALRLLVSHHRVEGGSWWLNEHSRPLRVGALLHEMTLVFGAGGFATNSALWSLTWEVLFSLLLPFFMTAVLMTRGRPARLIVGLAALSASAEVSAEVPDAIRYFPMFAIGIVLAIELPRLHAVRDRLAAAPRSPLLWALGGLAVLALTARWSLTPITGALPAWAVKLAAAGTSFLELLGATGIVALTLFWDGWRRQMERPIWQAAGKHSYSLYLVHEPIVVSTAFAFGVTTNVLPVLLVGVPLGLLTSYGFHRWVEAPSIDLATRAGKAARLASPASPASPGSGASDPVPGATPTAPSTSSRQAA